MKNIIYLIFALLVLGCQKEDALKQEMEFENLYEIRDDPNDPVKHRVYEIYEKYGVPVYFNDTIGKYFIKNDIQGTPVYDYEKLDVGWGFMSYSGVKYRYEYLTDAEKQLKALDLVKDYLDLASRQLYPFNFFILQSVRTVDAKGQEEIYDKGKFLTEFRSLVITGDWDEEVVQTSVEEVKRQMVKSRITNYKQQIVSFNSVSKLEWYNTTYVNIDKKFYEPLKDTAYFEYEGKIPEYYLSSTALKDGWYAEKEFTPEGLIKFRATVREKIGQFGFVSGAKNNSADTPSTDYDLNAYVDEMLRYPKAEFKVLWGECPLVMKKYAILYDVIVNELGVSL